MFWAWGYGVWGSGFLNHNDMGASGSKRGAGEVQSTVHCLEVCRSRVLVSVLRVLSLGSGTPIPKPEFLHPKVLTLSPKLTPLPKDCNAAEGSWGGGVVGFTF